MKNIVFIICLFCTSYVSGQPHSNDVLAPQARKMYVNVIKNSIQANLDKPLSALTETNWATAFQAMILLGYETDLTKNKIAEAVDHVPGNSNTFNKKLLRFLYAFKYLQYQEQFTRFLNAEDEELALLSLNYLYQSDTSTQNHIYLKKNTEPVVKTDTPILRTRAAYQKLFIPQLFPSTLNPILDPSYLPGKVLVISLMNADRNHPGIVLIRNTDGELLLEDNGLPFSQPILGRSLTNLPYYFSSGNTPQGFYRMKRFAVSKSNFIGPTPNVQLSMPGEITPGYFLADSTNIDSMLTYSDYQNFLPQAFQNNTAFFESWTAAKLGRTEIIAHGSTVSPLYYKNKPYFPFTPTEGCLTSKEDWNTNTGYTNSSDQQILNDKIKQAGGADGYWLVLDVKQDNEPVHLADILFLLK